MWMARTFPTVPFERYVDDMVVHCVSERQARYVLAEITKRMTQVGLALHPEKTRIVYCQDDNRRGSYEHTDFVFLGYGFRRRSARSKDGIMFLSFLPAISKQALKKISTQVRSWRLHHRTRLTEADLARWVNPIVRGWMNYYGAFYRSALYPLLERINAYLLRWVRRKYQRLRGKRKPARRGTEPSGNDQVPSPTGPGSPTPPQSGDQNDKSRITRKRYVRFCEGPGVKFPQATRPRGGGTVNSTAPGADYQRFRTPTISHALSQHCSQVFQSHSMSPSAPRGWVAPHKHRIDIPSGTCRSFRSMACRCPARGNQANG